MSVSYLDYMNQLTGFATSDTGNTTLTVSTEASCTTENDDLVAFGSLARDQTNQSEGANNDYILIENDGNVPINVTVNATDATTYLWDVATYNPPNINWRISCHAAQTGSCLTNDDNYTNIPGPLVVQMVYNLSSPDTTDNATIGINVTVPSDEPSGAKTGQVTFYCVDSGDGA